VVQKDALAQDKHIWTCPTREGSGYWIGSMSGGNVGFHAYLILVPRSLGQLDFLETKRAWVEEAYRRQGLGTRLLEAAAAKYPLLSDRDGMTREAFAQWESAQGFRRRWWDDQNKDFVADSSVPVSERLSPT
jgi:GNAT superfamily N-acetyltransferase